MKQEIINKATRLLSSTQYQIKKHSPEILMVAGIAGTIVGTVLACKATTKVSEIIEEKNKNVEDVHTCLEDNTKEYTEEDSKKDLTIIYAQTGVKLFKLYVKNTPIANTKIVKITFSITPIPLPKSLLIFSLIGNSIS